MSYFKDKVTLVTGGASGLGLALCEELARRGAKVVPVDIDQEGVQQVAADITRAGGEALFAYMDVTLFENAQRVVHEIVNKYGRLDIMINNAGTAIQGETRDLKLRHWRNVIDVNLWGVIYGAISAYRVMEKQGSGQIVNISSLAGLIPIPKEIPYCTSKWAVAGFTSSLRVEGADLGIKVNLVCPGIMHTPIHDKTPWVNVDKEKLIQPKVMKYFMTPDKAARKILRGIRQNKSVLIFPLYAHMIWWLYRFNPAIFQFVFKTIIRDFRKRRIVR